MKIHILILPSEIYSTSFAPTGAIFQKDLAKALVNKGFQVGVLSTGYLPFRMTFKKNLFNHNFYENENGVNVVRCFKRKYLPYKLIPIFFKRLRIVKIGLKSFGYYSDKFGPPDIIHAHNCFYGAILAIEIKRKFNIPFIVTEHSSLFLKGLSKTEKKMFISIYHDSSYFVTVSKRLLRSVNELLPDNIDKGKTICIPNIVDSIFLKTPLRQKVDVGFSFLNVANLIDLKNQILLLEAFESKFKGDNSAKLIIVGDGPNLALLRKKSITLGIEEKVDFKGYLNRQGVLNEMLNCDVFVLSSNYETFGVVLIEASACGKPLISTACGGPEDIIHDRNGILVPVNNRKKLAEAMDKIYNNYHIYNSHLIREDCKNNFSEVSVIQKLTKLYESVIM